MEQYIKKSAVVEEIERLITPECGYSMNKLIEFIDTLEVKEVNLNEYINKYFKGWYVDLTDQGNILHTPDGNAGLMSVKEVAKHFFELGLKVQKGELTMAQEVHQSQWKPSEYELEVLRLAAEKDGTCLMGLYENLKKLREE